MNASIKQSARGGVDVYVGGGYWQWFSSYDEAAEECNKKGYRVYG